MKRFLIFVALLLASMTLQAGEFVFHWNKKCEYKVFDMELMPDNEYFVVVLSNEFQVRRTEDGEIVNTYKKNKSFDFHDIEFTPDSSKLIVAYDSIIEIRRVKDFFILNKCTLPAATEDFIQNIMEIKVDPIRPYIYVLQKKCWSGEPGLGISEYRVIVYNYVTLEKVREITPTGFENKVYEHIAISSDGKYLSFINYGESYLVTIDLSTQKELQRFKICNNYSDGSGSGGVPVCIKFSEINSDKIYFSGTFPQSLQGTYVYYGLFIYSLSENKIIDSTFGVGNHQILNSYFTLFDKEKKCIAANILYVYITNFENKTIENKINLSENIPFSDKILYDKNNNYFIGYSFSLFGKVEYKINSNIIEKPYIVDTIYPNPTTNQVFIKYNCEQPYIYYKILNINSQVLTEKKEVIQNNLLSIDFSTYSTGYYIIQIECGGTFRNYMVIKEK